MEPDSRLLPKSIEHFASPQFWEGFFEARGGDTFEWYCEYDQLAPLFQNKGTNDIVFHAGCGNSNLCFELVEKADFPFVINGDFSMVALKEISEKAKTLKPEIQTRLSFLVLDCLNLPLNTGQFAWVVDKGLHDAMMKDSSELCLALSRQIFSEFYRVLQDDGKFLMVTLAQAHIIDLIEAAIASCKWSELQVVSLVDSTSPMLPFIVVFQKAKDGLCEEMILKFNGSSCSIERFRNLVTSAQTRYHSVKSKQKIAQSLKCQSRHAVSIDIKPWDAEVDLYALEQDVRLLTLEHVQWLPDPFEVIPIAYGICKLRILCVVDIDSRDAEAVREELEGLLDDNVVQSLDVVSSMPLLAK